MTKATIYAHGILGNHKRTKVPTAPNKFRNGTLSNRNAQRRSLSILPCLGVCTRTIGLILFWRRQGRLFLSRKETTFFYEAVSNDISERLKCLGDIVVGHCRCLKEWYVAVILAGFSCTFLVRHLLHTLKYCVNLASHCHSKEVIESLPGDLHGRPCCLRALYSQSRLPNYKANNHGQMPWPQEEFQDVMITGKKVMIRFIQFFRDRNDSLSVTS